MEKLNRGIKIFMIVLYLFFAAGIWWSPLLNRSHTELKIATSVLIVLYAAFRFFRLMKQKEEPAD